MKTLKFSFLLLSMIAFFSACQKEYSLEGGSLTGAGSWEFKDSLKQYLGNIDSAYIEVNTNFKILHLTGRTLDGSQTFHLHLITDSIFTTRQYKASSVETDFVYYTPTQILYRANQIVGEFIVNVTTLANNKISGTFSGLAEDSSANIKTLSEGKFSATIDLSNNGSGGGGGVATGVLGTSAGSCTPFTSSGTYTQGTALTASNTVQVQVTVATRGTYTISTNTVNGVSFSKSGAFTTTGVQTIILTGTGTPTSSGAKNFTVTFGTSTCDFSINFAATGPAAAGTLGGAPGTCTPATANGTYTQGTALTALNTLTIQVNVTTLGSYTIKTDTVNGVSFAGTGAFTTLGTQNVTLNGTGTPTNSGAQNFTVAWLTGTCNFSITFGVGTVQDYFPTTLNSNWTSSFQTPTSTDSLFAKVINYNPTFSGNTYSTITGELYLAGSAPTGTPNDSLYFRKPGGDYYEYGNVSAYFGFTSPTFGEFIFLKDNVSIGTTWQSPTFSGTITGVPGTTTGYIQMTLTQKAVAATVGTFNFPDVIKIRYDYYISVMPGSPFATEEKWFARGVGLVYDNQNGTNIYRVARYTIF